MQTNMSILLIVGPK